MRPSRSTRAKMVGAILAPLLVATILFPADSPVARAEACTGAGYPTRVLVSDTPGYIETQACLGNEWVTIMATKLGDDKMKIIEAPTDAFWELKVRSLFDLSAVNPIELVQQFKDAVAAGKTFSEDETAQWRLAIASVSSQAALQRGRRTNDGCKVRSRRFNALVRRTIGWSAPASVLPSTEPSTITFAFDPNVTDEMKVAILSAISQYTLAVEAQDAAFAYPQRIIPQPEGASYKPTIRFTSAFALEAPDGQSLAGVALPDIHVKIAGLENRWTTGEIKLSARYHVTPRVIGHEIGHVLGLDHMSSDVDGTMSGGGQGQENPWTPRQADNVDQSVAFDQCMFLPAD